MSIGWFGGLGSLLAITFGHLSRRQARRAGAVPSRMAMAGLVIGYIGFGGLLSAGVALPALLDRRDTIHDHEAETELRSAQMAQEMYFSDREQYATTVPDLQSGYFPNPLVPLTIVSADSSSYCMTAQHRDSDQTMYLNSDTGVASTTPCT